MKYRVVVVIIVLIILTGSLPIAAQLSVNLSAQDTVYVIQPEDTLWDLARSHNVTLEELLAANPELDPYALLVGTQIIIPSFQGSALVSDSGVNTVLKQQSTGLANPEPTPPPTGTIDYVIQEGDTLWALTYRFDVSFEALLAANPDVNTQAIPIGAIIHIPDQPISGELITSEAEPTPASLPGLLQVLDLPVIGENLIFLNTPLIDEGVEPTPVPFIEPRLDEFSVIEREIPVTPVLEDDPVVEGESALLRADELQVNPSPDLLISHVFPITIKPVEDGSIDFAQLSINDTTVATFDQPPYTYDLNVNTLGEGLYVMTFVTENSSGVLSSSTLEFEVAPLPAESADAEALSPEAKPLAVFVNGEQQALDLEFSLGSGLRLVQPIVEVVKQETLIDILARPANLIPLDIREAVAAPRPELFSIVIVIMTLTLIPQGLFTLFYMMYTWNNPEIAEKYRSPKEFFAPQFSFTAILPARREENVIYDTIRAIDKIDYPDHLKEILVMIRNDDDDATIAAAHRAAADIGKDHVHVITFTEGPKNKPNGLNRGLRASTKDVVCVFDAEDQPHPEIYNVINTVMVRDQADVVQSGVQLMNFKSTWFSALNCLEYFFWFKSGLHAFTRMFQVTPLGGNTVFFKRNWLEKVRGWDEACLTEDADIGLRLTQAGAKIQIVYDEAHATQEETPDSVDQFVKQRTRWNQGFYQVFFKGDWMRMPTLRQKITALYILLNSLFQALIVLYLPLGIYIMLTQSLPVPVALISWIPIFMLFTQLIVNLIGLGEFTRAYGQRMPFLFRLKTAIVYYPYQLMLSFSAARAIWRLMTNRSSWEKTAHSNLHRQNAAVAQGSV